MSGSYSVYRIRFIDKTEYFGVTSQDLSMRIHQHTTSSHNEGVAERMDVGMDFEVSLMARGLAKPEALALERGYIRSGENVLNVVGLGIPSCQRFGLNSNMKRVQVDLPKSLFRRIDETCAALNCKGDGLKITRTALLRRWIEEGLKRDRTQ